MTTHIVDYGYSKLFTAGLFNLEPSQFSPSILKTQGSFFDQFRQISPSPRDQLPPSDGSTHVHIQIPSGTEPKRRRGSRIMKSALLRVGNVWPLNRDVKGQRPPKSVLETFSAGSEQNTPSQAVSRVKRSIYSSPMPPPMAPLPSLPLSPRSDDTKPLIPHDYRLIIVSNQAILIDSNVEQALTYVVNEDSPFQGEDEKEF